MPSTNATTSQLIAALLPTVEKMPGSFTGIQASRSLQQLGLVLCVGGLVIFVSLAPTAWYSKEVNIILDYYSLINFSGYM